MTTNAQPVTPYTSEIAELMDEPNVKPLKVRMLEIILFEDAGYRRCLADLAPRLEAATAMRRALGLMTGYFRGTWAAGVYENGDLVDILRDADAALALWAKAKDGAA